MSKTILMLENSASAGTVLLKGSQYTLADAEAEYLIAHKRATDTAFDPTLEVRFSYNADGTLSTIFEGGYAVAAIAYDGAGNVTSINAGGTVIAVVESGGVVSGVNIT